MNENSYITEIKNEYSRIDRKWLKLHYYTSVGLVSFAAVLECILGLIIFHSGIVYIDFETYLIRYLVMPMACNLLLIIFGYLVSNSRRFKQNTKVILISLLFVSICFVFYSVHSIFSSLFMIFIIPILLTVVYGNYSLITITSIFSISAYIISAVFTKWDSDTPDIFSTKLTTMDFIISICILLAFYGACIVVIRFEREKNFASIRKEIERLRLHRKVLTDELTSISNRTALNNAMDQIRDDTESSYIFVMSDLDNFKLLNDKLGHDQGDQLLKIFADILRKNCTDGMPFRFGGDEFCILFKNLPLLTVIETCTKIQEDLIEYIADTSINIPLTASFGIAYYEQETNVTNLLKKADYALYRSKEVKNAIHVYNSKLDDPLINAL